MKLKLGNGNPNIDDSFFIFDQLELVTDGSQVLRGPAASGRLLRVVENKLDSPNFRYLVNAIVKIKIEDGSERFFKVQEVVRFEKFVPQFVDTVGELIGLYCAELRT